MRKYWFRRVGRLTWTPVTTEAWVTLGVFAVIGPGGDVVLLTNPKTAMFGIYWILTAVVLLVLVVFKTGEP